MNMHEIAVMDVLELMEYLVVTEVPLVRVGRRPAPGGRSGPGCFR